MIVRCKGCDQQWPEDCKCKTRPAPKLPEGYEERNDKLYYAPRGILVAAFYNGSLFIEGARGTAHLNTIAIWLQRRSK